MKKSLKNQTDFCSYRSFPSLYVDLGLSCSTQYFRLIYQRKHHKGNFSTFYLMDLRILPWRIQVEPCISSIFKRFSHIYSQHMTTRLQCYHGSSYHLKILKIPINISFNISSLDFFLIFTVQVLLHFLTWLGSLPQGKGISL